MQRSFCVLVALLAILAVGVACGDGDGTQKPAGTASADDAGVPEDGAGIPEDGRTPSAIVPEDAPRAVVPDNTEAFLNQFRDRNPTAKECDYEEGHGLVDCTDVGFGRFQLDPPVQGTGATCGVRVLDDEVIYILCTSEDPAFAIIYEVVE